MGLCHISGRVLAHAFFPYDSDLAGDIHMDESEKWAFNTNDGIDMSIVLAHEVGHSIGLGHSNISGMT